LIDLCGATLMYRSPAGIANAPTVDDLEILLNQMNATKPQCPVNLMTLGWLI
jgi:pellino protein